MKYIEIDNDGRLMLMDSDLPDISNIDNEQYCLIKVQVIGVNRADILQVDGLYNAPDGSFIPGLEVAGIDVSNGKRVCALLTSGGYAEYVVADKRHVIYLDDDIDIYTAAALPESLATCYMALVIKCGLDVESPWGVDSQGGQKVLIHGGASGIGHMAVQICRAYGAIIATTVGNPEKIEFCTNIGANEVFLYDKPNEWMEWGATIGGFNIVLDILGGPALEYNVRAMAIDGCLVNIAVNQGKVGMLSMSSLLMKNLTISGATLRNQTPELKAFYMDKVKMHFMKLIKDRQVVPFISEVYKLEECLAAHSLMRSRKHNGKILLKTRYA